MVRQIHVTKEGNKLLISEMENSHLGNTILYILRQIDTAKKMLEGKTERSEFEKAIYGNYKTMDKEDLQEIIRGRSEILQPYLGEAMLRGLDYTKELQETFERAEKISVHSPFESALLLEESDYEDVEDNF